MKTSTNRKNKCLLVFAGLMVLLSFVCGCNRKEGKNSYEGNILKVERQYVNLDGVSEFDFAEFVVDVPTEGPRPLLDSIVAFLNKTLYVGFEVEYDNDKEESHFLDYDDVYSADRTNLLKWYADKYSDYLKKNLYWFSTLNVFMIAQTETFVTYGVECYHGSGSTGSEFVCYTFSKDDGHHVKDIMTKNDVLRFMKDKNRENGLFDQWEIDAYSTLVNDNNISDVGLLGDKLILVDAYKGTHYALGMFEYDEVLPYMSEEAQTLVKDMGESCKWEECFWGERFMIDSSSEYYDVVLTVRPAEHDWLGDYECDEMSDALGLTNNRCYDGNDLLAFYVEDGKYTPQNIIGMDEDSIWTRDWDGLYTSNPEGRVYAYDTSTRRLFIPSSENVMMGHHESCDRYHVYQLAYTGCCGMQFLYHNEDGGFWLHPSLRQFGRLSYAGETKDYLVRVDEMRIYDSRYDDGYEALTETDTCRFRLALWKSSDKMIDKPSVVVYDGYYSSNIIGYVFSYNGNKYVVKLGGDEGSGNCLLVYRGDRMVDRQRLNPTAYGFGSVD